jgi:hypothetical protein
MAGDDGTDDHGTCRQLYESALWTLGDNTNLVTMQFFIGGIEVMTSLVIIGYIAVRWLRVRSGKLNAGEKNDASVCVSF